jgi:2-aminoadipate transaminase
MRLNFSGSHEDTVREGIRRIGRVVHEQVALYETLTKPGSSASRPGPGDVREDDEPGGDVVPMPKRRP